MKMEAEAGEMQPNPTHTRGSWKPPGGGGRMGRIGQERTNFAFALISEPSEIVFIRFVKICYRSLRN